MPTVTIDGREIEVAPGTTIMQACEQAGIRIPYYCYHPGLSIAGNCRMCLVEVEKMPKLTIACNTVVGDGMVVHTTTERVKKAQQGVLEIMLVNHPLDCPICDQAGECGLQDQWFEFSRFPSRFREKIIRKPKRKILSDHIVFDGERCILCSRCVRFCNEITKTDELGIFNRGAVSVVDLFPDKELLNDYQYCLADICPVGALTSRDFRFKCRVWYLQSTESICTKCARGCNIMVEQKNQIVYRYKPRKNTDVNQWWMCDEGRYSYKEIADNRVHNPLVRSASGELESVSWEKAAEVVAGRLKELGPEAIGAVASAKETNEANWALKKVFGGMLGTANLGVTAPDACMGQGDSFLKRDDKTPNRTGLARMGIGPAAGGLDLAGMAEGIGEKIKGLFLLGEDLDPAAAAKLEFLAVATPYMTPLAEKAHVVLPSAHPAEQAGTYTNFEGRVQKVLQGVEAPGEALPAYQILSKIAAALGGETPTCPAAIFKTIAEEAPAFAGLSWKDLGPGGLPTKG